MMQRIMVVLRDALIDLILAAFVVGAASMVIALVIGNYWSLDDLAKDIITLAIPLLLLLMVPPWMGEKSHDMADWGWKERNSLQDLAVSLLVAAVAAIILVHGAEWSLRQTVGESLFGLLSIPAGELPLILYGVVFVLVFFGYYVLPSGIKKRPRN